MWLRESGPTPTDFLRDTEPAKHQGGIDKWLASCKRDILQPIAPFVGNSLFRDQGGNIEMGETISPTSLTSALSPLAAEGRREDAQLAMLSLLPRDQPAHGAGHRSTGVVWGELARRADYSSHSLKIGDLYFPAVDLGDSLGASAQLQKSHWAPG